LDISKISVKHEEKESIITKGDEYLVTHTKNFKKGDGIWKIIKLKKEE
jgi:predicted RNA-binding protein with TRAM domain